MSILICAGGSGSRILESVLHLCAAGLGPDKLSILMIDPDGANGNGSRTKSLVGRYQNCRSAFGGKIGDVPFFRTELNLFQTKEGDQGLNVWSPVPPGMELEDIINYALLDETNQDVTRLLFTSDELKMDMRVGFLGHPSVGAAAMSMLPLYGEQRPWTQLKEEIKTRISQQECRVAIAGSVFGGTGSSSIHPLVRYLRNLPEQNHQRLKVAAIALAPYFQFKASSKLKAQDAGELAAKSEWFALATRAAVEFYDHLRENNDWDFDAMYWLGDDGLMEVDYSSGGPAQENPAHFVDLLAAIACLDYFAGAPLTGSCLYSGPRQFEESDEELQRRNVLQWEDIPLAKLDRELVWTRLIQFAVMGATHLGFFEQLLKADRLDREPYCVPWYLDRFATKENWLTTPENSRSIDVLSEYFRGSHFPWWREIHQSTPRRVRLLNPLSFDGLDGKSPELNLSRLSNMKWPETPRWQSAEKIDLFFTDCVRVSRESKGDDGVPAYVAMLAAGAERYLNREYRRRKES